MPFFAGDPVAVQGRDIPGDVEVGFHLQLLMRPARQALAAGAGMLSSTRLRVCLRRFRASPPGKLSASEIVDLDLELGSRNSGATAHRK